MTDTESQGDETDYGNKTICLYGRNNKFTDNQWAEATKESGTLQLHYSYRINPQWKRH